MLKNLWGLTLFAECGVAFGVVGNGDKDPEFGLNLSKIPLLNLLVNCLAVPTLLNVFFRENLKVYFL